jgi:pSer/pThr/pTyr-binding forkhead associated (FHA) protein
MAKLVLTLDGTVLKEHELTKERTTIGRKPHNDIQIDNLAISGEHAVIVTILNDSFLQDLDSTNGTQVNGRPVKKHFLQDNDIIEMAKYKIHYRTSSDADEDYEETLVLRSRAEQNAGGAPVAKVEDSRARDVSDQSSPEVMKADAKSEIDGAATLKSMAPIAQEMQASEPQLRGGTRTIKPIGTRTGLPGSAGIQFLTGPSAGREIEITKNLTTLGKPGSHLAVIARRKHGYFLTHVEGDAFPSINGVTLDAKAHALASHDIIELGGVKMEFFINP